jgi:hypothetical protein
MGLFLRCCAEFFRLSSLIAIRIHVRSLFPTWKTCIDQTYCRRAFILKKSLIYVMRVARDIVYSLLLQFVLS